MKIHTNSRAILFATLLCMCTLAFAHTAVAQQIIYVKADATGANNGSSWQDAFTQLQPAINAASSTDQIWVAGGTYYPTQQRIAGVNRSRSFVIPDNKDGLRIFGGFAGTETQLSQRVNPQANVSRLSGDVDQNDKPQNIYIDSDSTEVVPHPQTLQPTDHLVISVIGYPSLIFDGTNVFSVLALNNGITRETVFDGFTVSGGHTAQQMLELVVENQNFYSGGGLNCAGCSATFRNMRFEGNYSMTLGGGASVYNNGNPLFINTVFYGNTAGGAIPNNSTSSDLQYYYGADSFDYDVLDGSGGAMYVGSGSSAEIVSSTLFGNLAWNSTNQVHSEGNLQIRNSIIWGRDGLNHTQISTIDISSSSGFVLNSVVEANCVGGIACDQITQSNPMLDAALRITAKASPAVSFGNVSALPHDTDDLNGNGDTTEPIPYDAAGNPRIVFGTTDAGAFESPFGGVKSSPAAASPGQQVQITLPNANTITSISINGLPITEYATQSNNQVLLTIPEGATTGFINIVTPEASFSSTEQLIVTPGSGGKALNSNGGYVQVPSLQGALSVSFWVNFAAGFDSEGAMISKGSGSNFDWAIERNIDPVNINSLRLRITVESQEEILMAPQSILQDSEWRYVVVTFSPGNSNSVRFYIDGVSSFGSFSSAYEPINSRNEPIRIGSGSGFEIDNVMFWNRALSIEEINNLNRKHLKHNPHDPESNGLVASYRFDSDSPGTAYDYAGRQNGSFVGGAVRTEYSGAPVAAAITNPAGPAGAQIAISHSDYKAFTIGNPAGELIPATQPGESYGFDVGGVGRRSPVHWVVVAPAQQSATTVINFSDIPVLDGSLKVIYRPFAGSPWVLAAGNWLLDPALRTFTYTGSLPPGEYSIIDASVVELFALVRPHVQNAAAGEEVRFVVGLINSGSDNATEASTVELGFQGLENISITGGEMTGSTWTVGELAAGATAALEVTATRSADGEPAGLSISANNPFFNIQNPNRTGQVFEPVYETGQHIANLGRLTSQRNPDLLGLRNSDFTIEGWIRVTGTGVFNNPILSQLSTTNTNTLRIGRLKNNRLSMEFNGSRIDTEATIDSHIWYHLAFTYNKTTGERKIFIDGQQEASDVTGVGPITLDIPITISYWNNADNRHNQDFLIGDMHNLRFWNVPLSRSEILERMHQQIPDNDPLVEALTADFRFTEGSGSLVFDYAGGNLLIPVKSPTWNARGGVLFGTESAVAAVDSPATAGVAGASITASQVSVNEVILHISGRPDGPDRTPANVGESYVAEIAELVTGRPNVTWSLKNTRGATPQLDLELAYGALSLADDNPQRLYVIHRAGPDQDWSFDSSWTHHPGTKTFTRSGTVQPGEYSVISIPTANLSLGMELISIGSPNEDSFELRFTATNTGVDSPTETTVTTLASNLDGFSNLEADGPGFNPQTLSWTIDELATGETKTLTISGSLTNNIPVTLESTLSGSGVFNLSSAESLTGRQLISKAPYASGSSLLLDRELNTGANGNQLGLVNSSFTVEAWINPSVISGDQTILGQNGGELSRTLHLILRNGRIHMGFFGDDLTGQTDVPANTWSHVAYTYDVATNTRVVYLNGVADGSNNAAGPFLGEGNVYIGKWNNENYFNGRMEELRIWNSVRSPEEIRQNMHRTISMTEPDYEKLTAYYRFDDGTGTVAHDLRNGFHAEFAGASVWEASPVPLGQQSGVVEVETTGGLGDAGSRIELSNLTGSSAKLFTYGRFDAPLRTADNSNDVFTGLVNEGIEARTAKVWGIQASGEPSATVSISFSDLDDESNILQSPGLIFRPDNNAPWQLLPDSLWIKNTAQKTFTYTGSLESGEYAMAAFPFLTSSYAAGTAGWRMIGSPGPFARYSNVLSKTWTQGFPGASQSENGTSNVFFYDEATRNWMPPSSITNIFGTNSDFGVSSSTKAVLMYFFENQFPYQVQYSGVLNTQEVVLELGATVLESDDGNQGWHLISNPYPFPIDWTKVVADGLNNVAPPIFVYDANTFTGFGGYRVHYGFNIPSLPGDIMHDGIIPPFQAFFIRTAQIDGTSGTLTFKPTHQATTGDGQLYDAPEDPSTTDQKYLLLSVKNQQTNVAQTSLLDIATGEKIDTLEVGQPVALVHDDMLFGIQNSSAEALSKLSMTMEYGKEYTLPVVFNAPQSGTYEFSIPSIENWKHGRVTLTDHETGQVIVINEDVAYKFEYIADELKTLSAGKSMQKMDQITARKSNHYEVTPPPSTTLKNVLLDSDPAVNPRFSITIAFTEYVEENSVDIPLEFELRQNYPNPFNPTTTIQYGLPEAATIRLDVFNMLGQRVATLVNGEQTAGYHSVQFDGRRLASGVYIYRLQTGKHVFTQKMVLVK